MGENPTISFEFTSKHASRMIKYINNYTKQFIELTFNTDVMLRLNEWRFNKQTRRIEASILLVFHLTGIHKDHLCIYPSSRSVYEPF